VSPTLLKRVIIFSLVLLAVRIDAQEKPSTLHYVAVSPAEILKLLPPAPTNWKVTSSRASNQVTSWVLTIAQKSFESVVQPADPKTGPITMKTSITLIDTAGEDMWGGQFDNFKPSSSGNRELILIGGCPAIILKGQQGKELLTMSINNRFKVQLTTENQPVNSAKAWAATLDINKLNESARASKTLATLPNEVPIELVDELNPNNNRHVMQPIRKTPP
jgi:hypothetical protein